MGGGEQGAWPQLGETTPPTCLQLLQTHGEPQERDSCSGNWLLLTFISAGAVHWTFPHLGGRPPALTLSLHLRVTPR